MPEAGVVDLLDADTNLSRAAHVDAATEDLDDTELAGIVRSVLEAGEPHGRHRAGRQVHSTAQRDAARRRQPTLEARLLLTDHEPVLEALLTDRRTDRTGEVP